MKKFNLLTTSLVIAATLLAPIALVHADATTPVTAQPATVSLTADASVPVATDPADAPVLSDADQLAAYQAEEQDSSTGFFTRLILKFEIRQLENQIAIKKALQ